MAWPVAALPGDAPRGCTLRPVTMPNDLVVLRPQGLYCPAGDFYIDPWRPVERAVLTHAHSDHARRGSAHYLAHADSAGTLRNRLGADITLQTLAYGEAITHQGVTVSLHPAGHVLGSAQVRIEHAGQAWVASGDYKLEDDGTCPPFEPVRCHTFITESTFGLPIYRWPAQPVLFADINAWWAANAAAGKASVLYAYAFGKAPPSAAGTPWLKHFGEHSDAFASGWMLVRGARRRRGVDRGFVMSDHADWPGLQKAIGATGAERIIVTHGSTEVMVRWLCEQGLDAQVFATEYGGDDNEDDTDAAAEQPASAPAAEAAP